MELLQKHAWKYVGWFESVWFYKKIKTVTYKAGILFVWAFHLSRWSVTKGLFIWRLGILSRWGNTLRWGNQFVHIISFLVTTPRVTSPKRVTSPTWDRLVPNRHWWNLGRYYYAQRRLGRREKLLPVFLLSFPSCNANSLKLSHHPSRKQGKRLGTSLPGIPHLHVNRP